MRPTRQFAAIALIFACSGLAFAGQPLAGSRIIDGTNVPASQFPTVGEVGDASRFYGSGTLISPRHVLTAGHCAITDSNQKLGNTSGRFRLNGVIYTTTKVDVHPTFTGLLEVENQYDLAIFTLSQDVPGVTPSRIYRSTPTVGTLLTIAGYGLIGTGATGVDGSSPLPAPGTIQFGTTPIDIVTGTFIKWNFENKPAPNNESNTAPGDSGGPAFITENNERFLAGVTSGGSRTDSAFGDVSFDPRVDRVASWIDSFIGTPSVPPPAKADLSVTSAEFLSSPIISNTSNILRVTVQNTGETAAPAFYVSIFLNQNTPPVSDAGAATSGFISGLAIGATTTVDIPVTYPAHGTFSLAAMADAQYFVDEANKLNNTFFKSVTVIAQGVDVQIVSVTRTESVPGITAHFEVTIANRGATSASGFGVSFYASLFAPPTSSDVPTEVQTVGSLATNGLAFLAFNLPAQDAARAGRAYFLADSQNIFAEVDEGNNLASSDWGIANNAPDAGSGISSVSDVVSIGETVPFSINVTDANGDPLGIFWNFGDGTTAFGASVSHTFAAIGSYQVTVVVTDGPFHLQTLTMSIEVDSGPIDLGEVHLLVKKGRFKLTVPRPDIFGARDRIKSLMIDGSAGKKARYRNFRVSGVALEKGDYIFRVEFYAKKTNVITRVRYKFTVVD